MKLVNFSIDGKTRAGVSVDGVVYDIENILATVRELKLFSKPKLLDGFERPICVASIVAAGDEGIEALRRVEDHIRWVRDSGDPSVLRNAKVDEAKMRWLPPIEGPELFYGIGGNSPLFFRDKGFQIPAYPRGFQRPASKHSLIGHNGRVDIPASYSTMRASAEMGVVIGKPGKYIPASKAMEHVFGYTLVNDMCSDSWKVIALDGKDERLMHEDITVFTARASTSYYSRATDTFAAVGPWIVTKDEVPDPYNLMVYNYLSGVMRERSYTQAMVNGIEQTIAYMSRMFTLKPGMIIHMGTMGIDGYTIEPDMLLGPDDYFEIEYEKVGKLRCYVNDQRPRG